MKIAYLILAHKDPQLVKRLIGALRRPGASFYLAVDLKTDIQPFNSILDESRDDVVLVSNRIKVNVNGFTMVQATLNAMAEIRSRLGGSGLDHVCLLSGQDYPLKTNDEISDFLERHPKKEFISYTKMPTRIWWKAGMYRIEEFHLNDLPLGRYLRRVLRALLPRRDFPEGFIPFGGAQWWCLTYDCFEYILDFVRDHEDFVRFFDYTHIPCEMFFQTVVMNSPFADDVIGKITGTELCDELRYLQWDPEQDLHHPATLKKKDFEILMASGKLFARKFDLDQDSTILDLIDHHRAKGSRPPH